MKQKIWKRMDILVVVVFLLLSGIGVLLLSLTKNAGDNSVVAVYVDGKREDTLPLKSEGIQMLSLETNTIEVKLGKVQMLEADCPDKLCIKQGEISKTGESIICLPNKVVVTIEDGEQEFDAVAE